LTEDSSDFALEVLLEYINAVAAGIAAAKYRIREKKGLQESKQKSGSLGTDVANLPWKSYKTKQDARPEEAAWIFRSTKGAKPLVATLKAKGRIEIGDMEYSFSGRENQFISRNPTKRGS
jgi:hypothetical protein